MHTKKTLVAVVVGAACFAKLALGLLLLVTS